MLSSFSPDSVFVSVALPIVFPSPRVAFAYILARPLESACSRTSNVGGVAAINVLVQEFQPVRAPRRQHSGWQIIRSFRKYRQG